MKKLYILLLTLVLFAASCESVDSNNSVTDKPISRSCVAVNGKFISQQELDDLVVRSYGRKVLDDMVLLEVARQYAADKGVVLTDEMYEAELERFLNEIAPGKTKSDQQAIFAFVLKKRGLTEELFDLILKKQALLRACIDEPADATEAELQAEYIRLYGQKRTILLLATSSVRSMERAETALASGLSFSEVVLQYSEDETSLRNGGVVAEFSAEDTHLPVELRQQVFALDNIGDMSKSFQSESVGKQFWYMVRLESITPQMEITMEKRELANIVIRKETNRRILEIQDKLMKQAKVIIMDKRVK